MNKLFVFTVATLFFFHISKAQDIIPIDTTHFDINANAYLIEKFKGKDAIYLQGGSLIPKNITFLNGTIEYDIFLKNEQAFPGVFFRITEEQNGEQFYIRPHQSGNPDANQVLGRTRGISPWQLYHGTKYSFPQVYKYDVWTHVRIVVNGTKAQVFLDYAEKANLSWNLFHPMKEGKIFFTGGHRSGMHLANIKIDKDNKELVDFKPVERKPIKGLISEWELSDKFEEKLLDDMTNLKAVLAARTWDKRIQVEEGTAANIARQVSLANQVPGNTVFARVIINSDTAQTKLFEFGYSDRVVLILNGKPLYRGNNNFRSRDYRYLGTIGLFDAVYLNLNKGKNVLLLAVSENFGGWLVTGKLKDSKGIKLR